MIDISIKGKCIIHLESFFLQALLWESMSEKIHLQYSWKNFPLV